MAQYYANILLCVVLWSDSRVIYEAIATAINFTDLYRAARQISPSTPTFQSGVGCGTISVRANHVIEVTSNNFRQGNYFNNDACTWTFTASECDLSVFCPCFNIANSAGCLEDYLKIGYSKFHDKFCGENPPVGVYRATSDFLTLRFRSDYKEAGKGFLCYVRCTKPGTADPIPRPTDPQCPEGAINPYGKPNL